MNPGQSHNSPWNVTMTAQKLIKPEQRADIVPIALKAKPEFNKPMTPDQALAWAREALQVDTCKFARAWRDSTKGQRLALLRMIPEKYCDPACHPGYVNYEWAALPIKVQCGYKDVLQRFAKWVAERGLAS